MNETMHHTPLELFSQKVDVEVNHTKTTRQRVSVACVHCNKSHASCDTARPCRRCKDRGIAHLCRDPDETQRRKRGRKLATEQSVCAEDVVLNRNNSIALLPVLSSPPTSPQSLTSPNSSLDSLSSGDEVSFFLEILNDVDKFVEEVISHKDSGLFEILKKRVPMDAQELISNFQSAHTLYKRLVEEGNQKTFDQHNNDMLVDTFSLIKKYGEVFDMLASPMIVFDRVGTIYYVNNAYSALTGFTFRLPTAHSEYALYQYILAPQSIGSILRLTFSTDCENESILDVNSATLTCGIRVHSELAEKYINGTISVNVKRDLLGIPFLYIATFLPSSVLGSQMNRGTSLFPL